VATQSTSGLRRRVAGTQNAAQADVFATKHFGYCTLYGWTKSATSAIS
jgi:hypothetical protein